MKDMIQIDGDSLSVDIYLSNPNWKSFFIEFHNPTLTYDQYYYKLKCIVLS